MHKNNFDFLRLLFALLVMITHSYALTGAIDKEVASQLTHGQFNFSFFGLSGFFAISGYLVFQSLMRSKNLFHYYKKRILRIYPGLVVALILTVLLGACISNIGFKAYFSNESPYTYFFSQLSMFRNKHGLIHGVFEKNLYPVINGSIWTIAYEVFFYVLLSTVFFLRHSLKILKWLLGIIFIISFVFVVYLINTRKDIAIPFTTMVGFYVIHFGLFFLGGSILAAFNINGIRNKNIILSISVVLSIILIGFNQFNLLKYFLLPVVYILFGISCTKGLAGLSDKIGDLSYGIYIYTFVIQQTLLNFFVLNYWQLILVTIPVVMICGYLSWHFIEKRALRFKNFKKQDDGSPGVSPSNNMDYNMIT